MKEFQNRNPLRSLVKEVVMEQDHPSFSSGRRQFLRGFLFLLVLVCLLGMIVWHYSRFSTSGKFRLKTEDSGVISANKEKMEYVRLLVRNRYPFELTVTVRLCSRDGDTASPRFSILDKQHYNFTGTRSFYSGTFETRVSIVSSGGGRFHVTDRSGNPEELLNMMGKLASERGLEEVDAKLRASLTSQVRKGQLAGVNTIQEDRLTYGKEITKYCSLPGEHPEIILVITLAPKANYGR